MKFRYLVLSSILIGTFSPYIYHNCIRKDKYIIWPWSGIFTPIKKRNLTNESS